MIPETTKIININPNKKTFKTMGFILYIVGLVCAVWCVLDVFKKNIDLPWKLLTAVVILATSWLGLALYYFWARQNLESWFAKK